MSHLINSLGMDGLTLPPLVVNSTATFDFYGRTITIVAEDICLLAPTLRHFVGGVETVSRFAKFVLPERDGVIIDVGANIGGVSVWATVAFPTATVHSIEPSSYNYRYLMENTQPFDNIYLHKWAAHNEAGEVDIALPTDEQRPMVINTGQISIYGESGEYRESVQALPIDSVFDYADFIKIDAEGHTIPILEGAKELIEKCSPTIQVEGSLASYEMAGVSWDELVSYMNSIGYIKRGEFFQDVIFKRGT